MTKTALEIDLDSNDFIELLATKLASMLEPSIEKKVVADRMVTKAFLRKNVFGAGDNIDKIVRMSGFPDAELDGYDTKRYSLKAVNKWIEDIQHYN